MNVWTKEKWNKTGSRIRFKVKLDKMKAYLKRQNDNGTATTGIFFFEKDGGEVLTLASLELPWKENKNKISCIPKGSYKVTTTFSNRFKKDMWLLLDVPNRSGIRIHSANYSIELEGCIALGLQKVDIDNDKTMDIKDSKKAIVLAKFHLGNEFELEIL